ncbi:hypothetical protein WJX73_010269 [Symbiochloris irregularis]|uniref:Uncharacterized protein n=1 Tax=Symbiochloris irregularis TaxID=706552 RepID=A0AAW1NZ58_9CHLO
MHSTRVRLHLGTVELAKYPCFHKLTQLRDLTMLGCDQGRYPPDLTDTINCLVRHGSLEQLQVAIPALASTLVLPQATQPDNQLRTLLLSVQVGLPQGAEGQLGQLRALALMSAVDPCQHILAALTQLEALSLAGSPGPIHYETLASMSSLRVLDLRQTPLVPDLIEVLARLPNIHLLAVSLQEVADTIYPQWRLLREVDITQLPHDPLSVVGVPQIFTPLHRTRSLGIVLENSAFAGMSPEQAAADEHHMRLFDSFFLAHFGLIAYPGADIAAAMEEYDHADDDDEPDEAYYGNVQVQAQDD